jgi:7-carboxy-7-deazaguanine synthase
MGLAVSEIFFSIQGESSHAGRPCVFVRLAGCNLRCAWCDTAYAWEAGDSRMEVSEIVERVLDFQCPLVEVTGGEPLIQEQTPELVRTLLQRGLTVLLETNGSLDVSRIDPACHRIVDIKCPSSGMAEHNDLQNLRRLTERDELKFVIGSREDYEFAKNILAAAAPERAARRFGVNFSPVSGTLSPCTLAQWILEDRLPVRLNLQLHKILWDPGARGV